MIVSSKTTVHILRAVKLVRYVVRVITTIHILRAVKDLVRLVVISLVVGVERVESLVVVRLVECDVVWCM